MTIIQIGTLALIAACTLVLLLNWASLIEAQISKKGFSFAPPWICGLSASIAMYFYPEGSLKAYAWAPLLLDPSISLVLVALAWQGMVKKTQKKR